MGADGAAEDFARPRGVRREHPRKGAVTDEQQCGRAKDRPLGRSFASTDPVTHRFLFPINAAAGSYEMASKFTWAQSCLNVLLHESLSPAREMLWCFPASFAGDLAPRPALAKCSGAT